MISTIIGFIIFILLIIIDFIISGSCKHEKQEYFGGLPDFVTGAGSAKQNDNLRVLGFNIEYGAESYSVKEVADVIKKSRADVAILSEVYTQDGINVAPMIADELGFNVITFVENQSAIVCRWDIQLVDPIGIAKMTFPTPRSNHKEAYIVSVHFSDFPYQPNQAVDIPYCYKTCQKAYKDETNLIKQARVARGEDVDRVLQAIEKVTTGTGGSTGGGTGGGAGASGVVNNTSTPTSQPPLVILAGDFNEPSHLDWTVRAAAKGLHPFAVVYPTSAKFLNSGLIDVYRKLYPDEVKNPGFTWPTRDPGYQYRDDRIDFIYIDAAHERAAKKIRIIDNPSDHYAVLAEFQL